MKKKPWNTVRVYSLAATLAATACSSAAEQRATPQHLPTLAHVQTLAFIDWTGKPYSFGTHWQTLRSYVDYAVLHPRIADAVAALGIKTGFYVNVHTVCIARSYGECQPDATTLPEAAFVHSCTPPYGRIMWNPEKSAANPHPFYQFVGDVHSPVLAARWNNFIDRMRRSPDGPVHYDFAFEDNAYVPGDNLSWQSYYLQGSTSEQSPRPYCGYSDQNFIDGELHLENQAHIPLLLNAIAGSDRRPQASLAVSYLPKSKNALGAMLEYAYGSTISGPEREKESGDLWRSEENSELGMVNGHKLFVAYTHNGGSDAHAIDIRSYQYASLLLSFDQRYVMLAQDGPGTNSGIGLNPEIGIVAADPLVREPATIESLRTSSGAYTREFAHCTIWGKPIGACAAVVNPSAIDSIGFPHFNRRYAHRIVISGAGVVSGVDNGRVMLGQASLADQLPPKGWALLAQ